MSLLFGDSSARGVFENAIAIRFRIVFCRGRLKVDYVSTRTVQVCRESEQARRLRGSKGWQLDVLHWRTSRTHACNLYRRKSSVDNRGSSV